jgi:hypothetical protein
VVALTLHVLSRLAFAFTDQRLVSH